MTVNEQYIKSLLPESDTFFKEIENYAHVHSVPIMDKASLAMVLQWLRLKQPKKILEIGTAIGYSALQMTSVLPHCQIVTIERDEERYQQALINLQQAPFKHHIIPILEDALESFDKVQQYGEFDCVFIDAAKSQSKKFFELYEPLFSKDVMIITDNVLYKDFVADISVVRSRNVKQMVRKIQKFNEWLMQHSNYDTVIIPIGDGVAISVPRKK